MQTNNWEIDHNWNTKLMIRLTQKIVSLCQGVKISKTRALLDSV